MRRRLLNLLTTCSLLGLAASATLWLGSHHGGDQVQWLGERSHFVLVSRSGLVSAEWMSGDPLPNWGWHCGRAVNDPALRPDAALRRLGFDAFSGEYSVTSANLTFWTGRLTYVTAPWWSLTAALAAGPSFRAIALARARRARTRAARGLCAQCGYDLRATPEHCPECGASAL